MKNILMNTEMTKAILDGRKTQTRRVVNCNNYNEVILDELASQCGYASENYGCKHKDSGDVDEDGNGRCFTWSCPLAICCYEDEETSEDYSSFDGDNYVYIPKQKYQKGDIVWVREPAKIDMCFTEEIHFHYLADNTTSKLNIPKRFIKDGFITDWMAHCNGVPNGCIKEMARIFLKITDVRVERLFDLTYDDIQEEGYSEVAMNSISGLNWYIDLWNKTAPKGYKWDDNPYVFVYEFERVEDKQDV